MHPPDRRYLRSRQARAPSPYRNTFQDPEASFRRGFCHGAFFLYQSLTEAGALNPFLGARVRAYVNELYGWRAAYRPWASRDIGRDRPPQLKTNFWRMP
jgi:hypothetical protein